MHSTKPQHIDVESQRLSHQLADINGGYRVNQETTSAHELIYGQKYEREANRASWGREAEY